MSTYIACNPNSVLGNAVINAATQVNQALNKLRDVKYVLDQAQTGNPPDWATIGTLCGVTETEAEVLYGEIATALADIDTAAVKQMCARLGRGY